MSSEQKTIIVVEDEPDTAEMFGEMMHLIGYRVLKAYGGASAIGLLSQEIPHAVVLDLMMPEVDGFAVIDALKADEATASISVVVVTAKELTRDEEQRLKGRIDTLMQKGEFLNDELLDEVRSLVK